MDITLLGTGSPIPDPNRAGPSTLVRAGEQVILCDAGRGVVMRLAGAFAGPAVLSAILVTHLHSDHLTDLNDVITTRWIMSTESAPITIYGPVGLDFVVTKMMEMLSLDVGYRIAHHDDLNEPPVVNVVEVAPGDTFSIATMAGSMDVGMDAIDGKVSFVIPFIGVLWTLVGQ
jgi:ribonuclease Z